MTDRRQLFLLAVDHRRSFERLFGIDAPVGAADRTRLEAAKGLVAEALGDVAAERGGTAGGGLGILIDDVYGAVAIATARRTGVAVALAFERSGQEVLGFEHADWRDRLAADPPDFVKVLIRHRADGDSADIAAQLERLVEVSDACAASTAGFLLELLTPFSAEESAEHSADQLEARPPPPPRRRGDHADPGCRCRHRRVEGRGVADPAGCAAIVGAARAGRREETGWWCSARRAGIATVNRWLEAAAAAGYSGFAVGRSIWADSVLAHDRGELDAPSARARIAARYDAFIDTFRAAAGQRSS